MSDGCGVPLAPVSVDGRAIGIVGLSCIAVGFAISATGAIGRKATDVEGNAGSVDLGVTVTSVAAVCPVRSDVVFGLAAVTNREGV